MLFKYKHAYGSLGSSLNVANFMGTQASEFHSAAQTDLVMYRHTRLLSDVLAASLRATVWVAEKLKNSL